MHSMFVIRFTFGFFFFSFSLGHQCISFMYMYHSSYIRMTFFYTYTCSYLLEFTLQWHAKRAYHFFLSPLIQSRQYSDILVCVSDSIYICCERYSLSHPHIYIRQMYNAQFLGLSHLRSLLCTTVVWTSVGSLLFMVGLVLRSMIVIASSVLIHPVDLFIALAT